MDVLTIIPWAAIAAAFACAATTMLAVAVLILVESR